MEGNEDMSQAEHIRRLLVNHNLRVQALREKKALLGLSTPPEILIEIDSINSEIKGLQDDLVKLSNGTFSSHMVNTEGVQFIDVT